MRFHVCMLFHDVSRNDSVYISALILNVSICVIDQLEWNGPFPICQS